MLRLLQHEDIISVARQVAVGGNASALGPPFWLNRSVPSYCTSNRSSTSPDCHYPTYLQMDAQTRGDAEQLLASLIRTLVRFPDSDSSVAAAAAVPPFPLWVRPNAYS